MSAQIRGHTLADRAEGEITPHGGAAEAQIAPQQHTLSCR
jgi:hypothetical protein